MPAEDERDGYVPNVVYSCGALRHGDRLLLPYGASDASVRFAFVDVPLLVERLRPTGRRTRCGRTTPRSRRPSAAAVKRSSTSSRQCRRDREPTRPTASTAPSTSSTRKPVRPWPDDLGHRPERVGDHRRPGGQRLDDREPERLGEADEVQQRQRAAQQRVPLGRPDRADVADVAAVEVRFDELPK